MNLDDCLARACEPVPGLLSGALVLLPEGLLIGGVGEGGAFEREPLVRAAARSFVIGSRPTGSGAAAPFVEHVFVNRTELVVMLKGQRYPRLALALICSSEPNLAFVINSSRSALRTVEATIDLAAWEL